MSQYVEFYLKHPNHNKFLPLGDFCRSSVIYENIHSMLPYGKGIPLDEEWLLKGIARIDEDINGCKKGIELCKDTLTQIGSFHNSIAEKIELVSEYQNDISNLEEDMEYAITAREYLRSLLVILNSIQYDDDFTDDDRKNYLWAGVEWNPNYKEDE